MLHKWKQNGTGKHWDNIRIYNTSKTFVHLYLVPYSWRLAEPYRRKKQPKKQFLFIRMENTLVCAVQRRVQAGSIGPLRLMLPILRAGLSGSGFARGSISTSLHPHALPCFPAICVWTQCLFSEAELPLSAQIRFNFRNIPNYQGSPAAVRVTVTSRWWSSGIQTFFLICTRIS